VADDSSQVRTARTLINYLSNRVHRAAAGSQQRDARYGASCACDLAARPFHVGTGTTGADLCAGVPNFVAPFAPNDQSAWAERVADLGVGLHLPGAKKLTADTLAAAIRTAVTDSGMRARAAALGEQIRAEDGVARDRADRGACGGVEAICTGEGPRQFRGVVTLYVVIPGRLPDKVNVR
jgi:Erythromycin biosynthesis protein CIII-like, C-terminal domain